MKPSKELEMPVFSKNLERMDSIQPQNRPPKKKWWILILILCLVLILAGCILYFLLPSRSDTDSSEVALQLPNRKILIRAFRQGHPSIRKMDIPILSIPIL